MRCMACKLQGKSLFVTMWVCIWGACVFTYESWVRSAAWRFSLCVSRSIRSEPWSAVRELGERHTDSWASRLKVHAHTEIHAAIQPLKCYFLGRYCHNSYSQMGHCTQAKATVVWMDELHTCAHSQRDTQGTHKHDKQTHKEPCQGRRDQLPLQAW